MGKRKNIDKKQSVRFQLVPGVDANGKPTALYKPIPNRKSKLPKDKATKIISQISDYDQVTINGKVVDDNEIPAYVLEQIRGDTTLAINQKREQPVGDLYEIMDAKESDLEEEYYSDHEEIECDEEDEWIDEEDEWIDEEDEWIDEEDEQEGQQKRERAGKGPMVQNEEQFPALRTEAVECEGKTYFLTPQQVALLDTVIPQNYEQMNFGGLHFQKYNEDGLLLKDRAKYEQYIAKDEKRAILDSFQCQPTNLNIVDNDLKPAQIKGDVREVEEALQYQGQEAAYEELEDDFFVHMIQAQISMEKQGKTKKKQASKEVQAVKKTEELVITEEMLEAALMNFDRNIEEPRKKMREEVEEEEECPMPPQHANYLDIQNHQQYLDRKGQLDWRLLSRKQKKQYMRTKVIREYYDELRERQIQDKLRGKVNVKAEDLHLRVLVKHINYEDDHVMQTALKEDLRNEMYGRYSIDRVETEEESSSESEDENIISYHQRTSIIATNLTVIEEPKKVKVRNEKEPLQNGLDNTKIKVIPEKRNREQTKEQRKQRKDRLRQLKKDKKQQRKQFVEVFDKERRHAIKRDNPNTILHKISYVKIH